MPAETEKSEQEGPTSGPGNDADLSDGQLVDQFQEEGDEKAFNEIVRRYKDYVYNVVSYNVSSEEAVQDLAQQTFVNAYEGLGDFRKESSLKTWLFRIAKNLCNSHHRREGRNRETPSGTFREQNDGEESSFPEPGQHETNPADSVTTRERQEIVREEIEQLKEQFRDIILLREIEDHPYEEIADMLDVPVGTVRSRLYRARSALQDRLENRLGEDLTEFC